MTAKALKNIEHSVLAFYGLQPPHSMERLYHQVLKWGSRFGCTPDLMGTSHDRGKYLRFKNSERKVREQGFSSVTSFDICALPEAVTTVTVLEGVKCSFHYQTEGPSRDLIIDFRSEVVKLGSTEFVTLAREACMLTDPTYGIGYTRPFRFGPVLYAMGLNSGPTAEGEALRISHWAEGIRFKVFEQGLIRDVYPWNFLTEPQLRAKIGAIALQDWIKHKPNRGTLSFLTDRVQLWEVGDEDIPDVRKVLSDAGAIFDYDKYMDEHYPDKGEPLSGEEVLGTVLDAYGYESPDEVQILEAKGEGKFEELSQRKTRKIIGDAKKRSRKK